MNTVAKTNPNSDTASVAKAPSKPALKAIAANKQTMPVLAKAVAKPTSKAVAKPVAKPVVKPVPKDNEKTEKPKKIKLVRDSFTVPKNELNVLDDLKLRALSLKVGVKKSELLRAGIKALAAMSDTAFLAAVKAMPALKTGRPKK